MLLKLFYKLKYVTKPRKCSYASIPELYHCNEEIKSVNLSSKTVVIYELCT